MESLYELWGKRNPEWEKRYQTTIMDVFTDYGKGVNQYQDVRGKIFGAGYEIFIIAFFIGLYYDQTKPLVDDKSKRKVLGQAIMYWGNVENRMGRNSYGKIREYMFAALIAKTDVDLIALDKGDISARTIVDELISKMEQYANFGFDYIEEQLENDPNYFFRESAFLRVFTSFLNNRKDNKESADAPDSQYDEPDALD
ncbi:MAG: glycoside hydrolase family 15 [Paraprevotella sp.]|nr:glycoside hydrolase family 15 [Paraprevotella sp.]MDY3098344.1 glycoside hydrolase family 15 [Bacteroidaceae bacterium]MDY3892300.1 glycoside hydrolase family 15 [Bacteroidaceae bacterium]